MGLKRVSLSLSVGAFILNVANFSTNDFYFLNFLKKYNFDANDSLVQSGNLLIRWDRLGDGDCDDHQSALKRKKKKNH